MLTLALSLRKVIIFWFLCFPKHLLEVGSNKGKTDKKYKTEKLKLLISINILGIGAKQDGILQAGETMKRPRRHLMSKINFEEKFNQAKEDQKVRPRKTATDIRAHNTVIGLNAFSGFFFLM